MKEAFDANDLSIPFPQTDMHLHVIDKDQAAGPAVLTAQSEDDTIRHCGASSYAKDDNGIDEKADDGNERD